MAELSHDAEDGFHEIQLSGKQLVFLFMATTVVSVVIFLCGVLVGRGVHVERTPTAAAQNALRPSAVPPPTQAATQPVPQSAEPPAPAADDELTYHKRLEGEGAPAEDQLKNPATSLKRQSTPAVVIQASPPPSPSAQSARPGTWVVQAVALRDRAAANSLVQQLTGKGYPAFIVNPTAGSPVAVYKVQIGRYDDRREAEQVARRLEKEEKFNPWISR